MLDRIFSGHYNRKKTIPSNLNTILHCFFHGKEIISENFHQTNFCSSRVYFKSGNPEHPGDKFFNTTVDLLPYVSPGDSTGLTKDIDGFYTVANFSHETGIAEAMIDKLLGPISTVRLKVHSKSESWIILNEVSERRIFN